MTLQEMELRPAHARPAALGRVAERIGFCFEDSWVAITYDWKPALWVRR